MSRRSVSPPLRVWVKGQMARAVRAKPARGTTVLLYHRIGGGTTDELDVSTDAFAAQLDVLQGHDVVSLDTALDRLHAGDDRPTAVLTFDDGFRDVHTNAWPLLRERDLPFTIYLASSFVAGVLSWEGATAGSPGRGLEWAQLAEMRESGLCTVGNHTHTHPRPDALSATELDTCSEAIRSHLGAPPRHFAFTWGIDVPAAREVLRSRFRSAATGRIGRNLPGCDPLALRRVPVRRTDPIEFFGAKLVGRLVPEHAYDLAVRVAKRAGARP